MTILSIDIGTKNLGWAVFSQLPVHAPPRLERAELSNIEGKTIKESIDNLLRTLQPAVQAARTVLIEQQPLRHAKMLSIMYGLYGALRALEKDVHIVSPRLRVGYLRLPASTSYSQRKKASVTKVTELYGAILDNRAKADDVADAIMQGVAWIQREYGSSKHDM